MRPVFFIFFGGLISRLGLLPFLLLFLLELLLLLIVFLLELLKLLLLFLFDLLPASIVSILLLDSLLVLDLLLLDSLAFLILFLAELIELLLLFLFNSWVRDGWPVVVRRARRGRTIVVPPRIAPVDGSIAVIGWRIDRAVAGIRRRTERNGSSNGSRVTSIYPTFRSRSSMT